MQLKDRELKARELEIKRETEELFLKTLLCRIGSK